VAALVVYPELLILVVVLELKKMVQAVFFQAALAS
jgi:hypothetical protein